MPVEHRFGVEAPFALGVEEELMILDATTLDQVPEVERLRAVLAGRDLPGEVKTELFASVCELTTRVCPSAAAVDEALGTLRREVAAAAAGEGLALAAAGTHPFARPEEQAIVPEERYLVFVAEGGMSVRRQGVQGLHVHVSMPDPDSCWRCLELVLPWLPVVLAMSANSPWLTGEATGFASNRAPRLAELPRAGAPPAFASYAEWQQWVDRLVSLGTIADYTRIWWDVRPHPKLGTLEIRVPDQPTAVGRSAAFAALVQALCATALAGGLPEGGPKLGDRGRAIYLQNRWAAARLGPRARLVHPRGDAYLEAAELGRELLELVRPAAGELDGDALLDRLDPAVCEADAQLAHADPRVVAAALVERSLA